MLTLEVQTGTITTMSFAPDGATLAYGTSKGLVNLWNPHNETIPHADLLEPIHAVCYSPDGQYVVAGGASRTLLVWELATQRMVSTRLLDPFGITSIAFVGSRTVLFGIGERPGPIGRPTTMFLYEIGQPKWRPFPFRVVHGIRAIAGDSERRLAVWATDTKQLHVQDITRQPARSQALRDDCRALALSPDARWVAVAMGWDVVLYDVTHWPSLPISLGRHQGTVSSMAFAPDSRTLFSGSWDKTVRAWDLERQLEKACYTWNIGRIGAIALAPDGLRAAAAGDTGSIAIWDLDD